MIERKVRKMLSTVEIVGLVLLIVGIILVGIEMILPGFGVPGISGTVGIIIGIIMMSKTIEQGLKLTAIVIVILALMLAIVVLFFHSKKIKSPIVLDKELTKDPGYISSQDLEYLVGKQGETLTALRPAGKCDIEGVTFEVRSEGAFIEKNKKVSIVKIQSNMIVVKEC